MSFTSLTVGIMELLSWTPDDDDDDDDTDTPFQVADFSVIGSEIKIPGLIALRY